MTQQSYIQDVMESMGWTDGNYIPIANEENKKLMESITELLKTRTDKIAEAQTTEDRLNKIRSHYKNAEQDIDQNLKLLHAYRSQLTTESHMEKVSLREDSKLKQLLKEIEKEKNDRVPFEESTEKEIKRITKNIERLSEKIDWAKLALVEWRQAMIKGDETNKMIEKYCQEDQKRINCLNDQLRNLQESINKQKSILLESCEEKRIMEQCLDRTAELYRQAHHERRKMVDTWKEAVMQMNQREHDIEKTELHVDHMKNVNEGKTAELKENDDFLNQLMENNKEVEKNIGELNEQLSSTRKHLNEVIDLHVLRDSELDINRKILQAVVGNLHGQRRRNKQFEKDKEDKEIQIANAVNDYKKLKDRYNTIVNVTMSAQERLQQIEELINMEERTMEQCSAEMNRINSILFRSQQQLRKFMEEGKIIEIENRALEGAIIREKAKLKESEKDLQQKIEADYNTAFKVQIFEMKVSKLSGTKTDFEKTNRITNLEKQAEATAKELNALELEIKRLEDDTKTLTILYDRDNVDIEKMHDKMKESELYCIGGEKQLKATIHINQGKIVELSIMKMRLHEMEKQIAKHNDKAYNLEKHRMELEKTTRERLIEIKTQTDLLNLKRKHLLEEIGTLKVDLGERAKKLDAVKKRYELSVELMGRNEDGSLVTATQVKIEASQEKQMLLHEGNELNEKVLKAENDIKAMENTLCLINFSNNAYRKTFENLEDETPELTELKTLQENFCSALQKLKGIKSNINVCVQNIEQGNERFRNLEKEMEESIRTRLDHKEFLMKIYKELMDQKSKLQRAERELKLAQKAIQQKCLSPEFIITFEKSLDLSEYEGRNTAALQLIADLVDMNPEVAGQVSHLFYEKDLKLPQISRVKSQTSWRSDYSEICEKGIKMKGSYSTSSSSSTRSSTPSICSSIQYKMTGSASPSVVSIDFPDKHPSHTPTSETSSTSKSKEKEKKKY